MTDTVPVDDPWVYITDSGEDIKFSISEGQTMSTEIKVRVGYEFNYLGVDCVIIGGGRAIRERTANSDSDKKSPLDFYRILFFEGLDSLDTLKENDEIIYEYVSKKGEIVDRKMTGAFMKAMVERGKIVLKG